jgi:hypothetical protein
MASTQAYAGRHVVRSRSLSKHEVYEFSAALRTGWKRTTILVVNPIDGLSAKILRPLNIHRVSVLCGLVGLYKLL